jgi:hypothetical protein
MLKKIILPLVLLIFAHEELYGTEEEGEKEDSTDWESINQWVNVDCSGNIKSYPKLWLLWTILDNIHFQYGGSKIWKHGEAYYGLSNGIGFFPSFLNFGWLKVGIIDAHINVINLILDFFKNFIQRATDKDESIGDFLLPPILVNSLFNIHIISVKILNCIKIKLVAPLTIWLLTGDDNLVGTRGDKDRTAWYITYNTDNQISWWYALLSPRIEINIP